jgi:hypothetical protein
MLNEFFDNAILVILARAYRIQEARGKREMFENLKERAQIRAKALQLAQKDRWTIVDATGMGSVSCKKSGKNYHDSNQLISARSAHYRNRLFSICALTLLLSY